MKKYSRVKKNRNKRIKQYLKLILSSLILLIRTILELLVYLIKNLTKIIYKVIFKFNTLIGKLFMKLPRITKVLLIYVLVLNFVINVQYTLNKRNLFNDIEYKKIIITGNPKKLSIAEAKKEKCIFDSVSCKIREKGKEIGLNEEQILISIAISKWETGNYTSKLFKENNNVGGMYCNGNFIKYDSLEEGIEKFLINLKSNYFDIGLDTIEKIQPKYCPIGAENDPNGLNKNWIPGVTKFYNELKFN